MSFKKVNSSVSSKEADYKRRLAQRRRAKKVVTVPLSMKEVRESLRTDSQRRMESAPTGIKVPANFEEILYNNRPLMDDPILKEYNYEFLKKVIYWIGCLIVASGAICVAVGCFTKAYSMFVG